MLGTKAQKSAGPDSKGTPDSKRSGPKRLLTAVDHQRSEFLRRCRSRIKPEDVGLPQHRRARIGGLRREDVAVLASVSVSWYTWLEQGRDIRVSDEVLERLSQTFRLTEDERTYLFSLVQQRPPRAQGERSPTAPPDVVRMLQSMNMPAIAMNLRWDVLAWNELNTAIYRDYGALPVGERNLLEILLTKPVRHMSATQLEATAQRLCARLRYDYSKCADDPKFDALVRRLSASSPLFSRVWRFPDFTLRAYGLHRFTHARFGSLAFEHTSYVPDGYPGIRVVICNPENAAARRAIELVTAESKAAAK